MSGRPAASAVARSASSVKPVYGKPSSSSSSSSSSLQDKMQEYKVPALVAAGALLLAGASWALITAIRRRREASARAQLYALGPFTKLDADSVGLATILARYKQAVGNSGVKIRALHGGLSNSNFQLTTEAGTFLLKVCDEKSALQIHVQCGALNVMQKHNVRAAFPIQTDDGAFFINVPEHILQGKELELGATAKMKPVVMYEFLPGRPPKVPTPAVMEGIAVGLTSLNRVPSSAFSAVGLLEFPMGINLMQQLAQEAESSSNKKLAEHAFIARLKELIPEIQAGLAKPVRQCVCHGDLFLENVMFKSRTSTGPNATYDDTDVELSGLIDFEEMCLGPLLLDVAMTIVGCCYDSKNRLNSGAASIFLKSYQKSIPLNDEEKKLFPFYVKYALLAIASWRFRQFQIRNPDEERKNSYNDMMIRYATVDQVKWAELLQ